MGVLEDYAYQLGEAGDGTGQGASVAENYRLNQIGKETPVVEEKVVVPAKLVSTQVDPQTGDIIDIYDDGTEKIRRKGTVARDEAVANAETLTTKQAKSQSAYDLLYEQFKQYGLESLVAPLKGLITSGAPASEFTIKLRETEPYKKRFAANAERIAKGLTALDEATYLAKEDQYQNVMRAYGLPDSYWKRNDIGGQEGFQKLLANDVSATELESRVQQAADVIDKGSGEYLDALKKFYPEIQRGDLMAYVLDPKNALPQIQSKVGAAKIGGEYLRAGLGADQARAEELQRLGITAEQARTGAQAVKETAPLGGQYAAMYGLEPYGQADVEQEVYGLGKASEAKKKRERIVGAVTADFSGSSGVGALSRDRSNPYGTTQSGYGQY
jgi:hypothetical protein